jgi:ubiquinone/menaquinone biosynthesis C-methylase UbiE
MIETSTQPMTAFEVYQQQRRDHWDAVAAEFTQITGGQAYQQRLAEVYRSLIPAGSRVLEIGCAAGDLLAALEPSYGVGVDFSAGMLDLARSRYPHLHFIEGDAHSLHLDETFDTIILSDLVNDVWDVQTVLENLAPMTTPRTRIIVNSYSRLWEMPLKLAQRLKLAKPTLYQNWLTTEDIGNLLRLCNFELIRHWQEVIYPLPTPVINPFANRYLARMPLFKHLAVTNLYVARPMAAQTQQEPLVSVIVPARNEAGNIEAIFQRTPEMGRGTELVFVEGHSRDNTYDTIEERIAAHPERHTQLHRQTGVGKGDAVRLGFEKATGDVLMILDADLTMPPEDLPRFYEALVSGKGEFVNGVRLVYPMEDEAMRFANLLGNKFFSYAFSWLLGQPIKDTLCGTKVLWKRDYERIAANRSYFGDFDPFGDFDLLLGAARQSLKIVDIPIRYRQRTYGTTNIQRWRHGLLLMRMVVFAARRIKFV